MVANRIGPRRLAVLLAAAGLRGSDVLALMRELRAMPSGQFMELFETALEQLDLASELSAVVAVSDVPNRGLEPSGMSNDLAAQVERLLIGEAGMTKIEAARSLEAALQRRRGSTRAVPDYNPKDGFARWLRQLSQGFTLSEILHAASTVRNSRVHGQPDDWLGRK